MIEFFKKYFFNVLKNHYADFKGRATRKEYWFYFLSNICVSLIALVLFVVLFLADLILLENYNAFTFLIPLGRFGLNILNIALVIPSLSIAVRRFHDTGRSGWWLLMLFIPIIGWFWCLFILCEASQRGQNDYGDGASTNQIGTKT